MNFSHLLTQVTNAFRSVRYGDRMNPVRDWHWVISIAFVLLIASAGWSYAVFENTSSGELLGANAQALPPITTASLEAVRTVFDARAAARAHYLSDYHFVDPSR
jgi:hypothetical protein